MFRRILPKLFGAGILAALAVVFLAPSRTASAAAPQVVPCKCNAQLSLQPNANCPCPGLSVSNVLTRKGRCGLSQPCSFQTQTCRVQGTVTETGCSGGFSDPFEIESQCDIFGPYQTTLPLNCTGGSGLQHSLLLTCQLCS